MRARLAALVAATAIIASACSAAATPEPSTAPSPSRTPAASATPAATPVATPVPSPVAPTPHPSPLPASLPVTADASDIATGVQMAPRPDGGLFVSIPAAGGTVLASLDEEGTVGPGWPTLLAGASRCLLDTEPGDGSVRAVCAVGDAVTRAYAFGPDGRPLAGWPVDLQGAWPRTWGGDGPALVDGDLFILLHGSEGPASARLVRVSRNGLVASSPRIEGGFADAVVGPDGTAYLRSFEWRDPIGTAGEQQTTTISAFTLDGPKPGFPVSIDGMASTPSFDNAGRLYVATDATYGRWDSSSEVIGLSGDGRIVDGWPLAIPIDNSVGVSDGGPGPAARPVIDPDGSVYVVGWGDDHGTVAFAFDPSGRQRAGWPYRSQASVAYLPGWSDCACQCQPCSCDTYFTPPAADPDSRLIVVEGTDRSCGGDRIVAIGTDGKVAAGWPVELDNEGSWFAGIAVGDHGIVYGYAIEPAGKRATSECPEPEMVYSGTIVALDDHGDPIYTTTLVLP